MTDGMSLGRQQAGQLAGTLTGPPERGHGIASGIRVNQSFQRLHQLGVVLDQRLPSSSRVPYSLNGERWLSKALDSPIDGRTRESGKTGDAGNTPSSQLLCIDDSDKVLLPLIQVRKQQAVFLLEFFSCAHTNSVTQRASFVTIINVRDLTLSERPIGLDAFLTLCLSFFEFLESCKSSGHVCIWIKVKFSSFAVRASVTLAAEKFKVPLTRKKKPEKTHSSHSASVTDTQKSQVISNSCFFKRPKGLYNNNRYTLIIWCLIV